MSTQSLRACYLVESYDRVVKLTIHEAVLTSMKLVLCIVLDPYLLWYDFGICEHVQEINKDVSRLKRGCSIGADESRSVAQMMPCIGSRKMEISHMLKGSLRLYCSCSGLAARV